MACFFCNASRVVRVVILGDAVMLWVVGGVVSGRRREFGGGIRCWSEPGRRREFGGGIRCWSEPGREQADNVLCRREFGGGFVVGASRLVSKRTTFFVRKAFGSFG
jgi:hypothetical protein